MWGSVAAHLTRFAALGSADAAAFSSISWTVGVCGLVSWKSWLTHPWVSVAIAASARAMERGGSERHGGEGTRLAGAGCHAWLRLTHRLARETTSCLRAKRGGKYRTLPGCLARLGI